MMRIAFQTNTRPLWMAGMVAFQDLLIALRTLDQDRPMLELVQWINSDPEDYGMLTPLVDGIIPARFPPPPKPVHRRQPTHIESSTALAARVRRGLARKLVPPPPAPPSVPPDKTLCRSGIDCTFSVLIENRTDLSVPLLTWIYDLQHHHFPKLIPASERRHRDEVIRQEVQQATRLIVKSSSIAGDLVSFLPDSEHKVSVLPWVSHIPDFIYRRDAKDLLDQYHLPDKFFYIPNQFWTHKNHALVIHALRILRGRGLRPVVICTGNTYDHRSPDAFTGLMREVSLYDLRDQLIILGSLPREQVFELMRQSIVVLNPSHFEGYGLSASEAKSLGKRTLLSDLPSLREQDPPLALYFDPNDAQELAGKMEQLWLTVPPGPDLELEREARAALPGRQLLFARAFMEIATLAIKEFHALEQDSDPAACGGSKTA